LKEFAKRFVADVEAIVGEALPDLLPRLSGGQDSFNFGEDGPDQRGFRAGRFGSEFLQGVAEAIYRLPNRERVFVQLPSCADRGIS
jgi:hypothetical protein